MDNDIEAQIDDDANDEQRNEDDVRDQGAELEQRADPAVRAQMQELAASALAVADRVEQLADAQVIQIRQLPRGGAANAREAAPGDPGTVDYNRIRDIFRSELLRVQSQPTVLNSVHVRWALATLGIVSAINATHALYAWIKSSQGGQSMTKGNTNDDDFPTITGADAETVKTAWHADEVTFWNRYAAYVQVNTPRSYPEQLLFMQFTEDLAAGLMTTRFIWDSAEDKLALINAIESIIASTGLSQAYQAIPALTYKSSTLPRAVSASIISLALTSWLSKQAQAAAAGRARPA